MPPEIYIVYEKQCANATNREGSDDHNRLPLERAMFDTVWGQHILQLFSGAG
jgi:hypothetical protein